MFTPSSHYTTLAQQVARDLERDIRSGILRESLPGERKLAVKLQVSRRTIRTATEILEQKHLVQICHGKETKILAPNTSAPRDELRNIGLLLPKPLDNLKPYSSGNFEAVRTLLYTNGYRLDVHFDHRFLSSRPGAALTRLVRQFPCDGWILGSANRECQAWFHSQGIPTIFQGTAHDGIVLPFVDLDMRVTARHAVNILLRKGHRRIGLVMENSEWAGYRRTEQGFLEGLRGFGQEAVGQVFRHNGKVSGIRRLVERMLHASEPVTALFVVNPYHYLALSALLSDMRVRVPDEISLLCRDDDACLDFLPVSASRYTYSSQALAKELFTLLKKVMQVGLHNSSVRSVLMLPEYVEGASVSERKPARL